MTWASTTVHNVSWQLTVVTWPVRAESSTGQGWLRGPVWLARYRAGIAPTKDGPRISWTCAGRSIIYGDHPTADSTPWALVHAER